MEIVCIVTIGVSCMKNLIKLICALLLLCGILLYWNRGNQQIANKNNVVIQQATRKIISPTSTSTAKSQKNRSARKDWNKKPIAETTSPRTVSDIVNHKVFKAQEPNFKQNNTIDFNTNQNKDSLFTKHNDDLEFHDTQQGPDEAFTKPQQITLNTHAATINKPRQINDLYQVIDTYTGTNPKFDRQLLQNNSKIIDQEKLVHDLKSKDTQMYEQAKNTPRTRFYTLDIQAMEDNYNNLINAQKKLESLYQKEDQIMATRKNTYTLSLLSKYPTRTKIASPYNQIGNMLQSSLFMKTNTMQRPATKPIETSSIVELD